MSVLLALFLPNVVIGADQLTLTWDDSSDDELGFRVERSADGAPFQVIATLGPNTTSFVDTALTPGTAYSYRVLAFNAIGDSPYSNVALNLPVITAQPTPALTAAYGDNVTLNVNAIGAPGPIAYQWLRNGVPLVDSARIVGSNSPELLLFQVRREDAGSYSVQVSNGNQLTSQNSFLTIQKLAQSLAINYASAPVVEGSLSPGVVMFESSPVSMTTWVDSKDTSTGTVLSTGLPIIYERVSGPYTLGGVNNSTITFNNVGIVTVRATQPGNSDYNPATPVDITFAVESSVFLGQTITFNALSTQRYLNPPYNLTATSTSGLPVSYASSNTAVATIDGRTVTVVGPGTTIITASQPGDSVYLPAPDVSQVLTVIKMFQNISFANLSDRSFGEPPFTLNATATSGLPVNFISSNSSVISINGNVATIVGAGSATITARQPGDFYYNAAGNQPRLQVVNKANQTISFPSIADRQFSLVPISLDATSTSGLPITYTIVSGPGLIAGSSLTLTGAGIVTVRAAQPGNANYNAATSVDRSFTVGANFDSWRASRFTPAEIATPAISGPNAVFGQDGLTNQVKYALGLEPKTNIVSGQPVITDNGTEWVYTYTRPDPAPPEVNGYVVEVSTDLRGAGGWTTAGVTHEQVSSVGGVATWRARFPLRGPGNPGGARAVAFRLKTILGANPSYAPPLAGLTVELPSGQTATLGLPLAHFPPSGAGAVMGRLSDTGPNYIAATGAAWTAGALSDPAAPYFLRIRSGASAGRVLPVTNTPNTDSRLYVDTDGVSLAQSGVVVGASGDGYELVPAETLASVFSGRGLTGGSSAAAADLVQVWSGASWLVFYFNTDRNRWERNVDTAASPSRDSFVLRPDRGILVQRRNAGPATIYLQLRGRVPEFAPRYFHARPGTTFVATGVPADLTLAGFNSGLGVGAAGGWTPAASPTVATATGDLLLVWSPVANRWLIHYFDSTNSRWQEAGDLTNTDRNNVVIPAGQAVILRRLGTSENKLITLPFPYTIER